MNAQESIQGEIQEIEQCPTREICPLGSLCGVSRKGYGKPLFPVVRKVKKGELIWTTLRFENQVVVVRKGVYVSIGTGEQEEAVPFALLGKGNAAGLAEAYTPAEVSEYYHIRTLIEGEICTLPAKVVRRKLEELPQSVSHQIICCSFISQSISSFTQTKIVSKKSLYERILALLLYLQDMTGRQEIEHTTLEVTHEEISMLVASDRASVTRVLHKMSDDGILSIGYKSITLHNDNLVEHRKKHDSHICFVTPADEAEHLKNINLLTPRSDKDDEPFILL